MLKEKDKENARRPGVARAPGPRPRHPPDVNSGGGAGSSVELGRNEWSAGARWC